MLMMSRRQGETIRIGEDIEIVIAGIHGPRVKVGIRAPREMTVIKREIKLVKEENLAAAESPRVAVWSSLMERFQKNATGPRSLAESATPGRR
jgi:carbon storage regulator